MSYEVRYIKDREVIAVDTHDEKPDEDKMRETTDAIGADFPDVCRSD